MLDMKFIRKNIDVVRAALKKRNSKLNVDDFLAFDEKRRTLIEKVETMKAERNSRSGDIAKIKREGGDASAIMKEMGELSASIKSFDAELTTIEEDTRAWIMSLPNIPHESTPEGTDEEDNEEIRLWGEKPAMDFEPKEHWELGTDLDGLDFERAAKISGSRFCVTKGWAAKMERALAALMLDMHTEEHGYTEVAPPVIVNAASMTGTGQLPKFEEDLFKLTDSRGFYLIPTAEVPVTNLYRDEVMVEAELPLGHCAHTPCFRSEAGSYGKDTKGLIRQHQFYKVELVRFVHPEKSYDELEELTKQAERVLQRLNLHYRVVALCAGDLGFSSAKTYDLEVWLPGQDKFREISSCSNFEDFQARRANIRFQPKDSKKKQYLHTLNGSGLAIGRTLVAVLENYQQADGSIVVPEALRPYMGGLEVIEPVE
ncbi:MAG: serine--tRNA ligase [Desulfovibrio sp.]